MTEPEDKTKSLADILEAVGVEASTEQVKEIVKALDLYESIEEAEPEGCQKEYNPDTCDNCIFRSYILVPHPSGHSTVTTEKASCDLGYWEDDF